jgi:hypothetical protein
MRIRSTATAAGASSFIQCSRLFTLYSSADLEKVQRFVSRCWHRRVCVERLAVVEVHIANDVAHLSPSAADPLLAMLRRMDIVEIKSVPHAVLWRVVNVTTRLHLPIPPPGGGSQFTSLILSAETGAASVTYEIAHSLPFQPMNARLVTCRCSTRAVAGDNLAAIAAPVKNWLSAAGVIHGPAQQQAHLLYIFLKVILWVAVELAIGFPQQIVQIDGQPVAVLNFGCLEARIRAECTRVCAD